MLLASNIIAIIATAAAAAFLISYVCFFSWRKTWAGVAIVVLISSLLAFGIYSAASAIIGPDWPVREILHLIVNCGLLVAILVLLITLWTSWAHAPHYGHRPSPPGDQTVPGASRASSTK